MKNKLKVAKRGTYKTYSVQNAKNVGLVPSKSENWNMQEYIVQDLECANCAAKMERKIGALPQVERVTLTYTTKQLKVYTTSSQSLQAKIQEICSSIESQVKVVEKRSKKLATEAMKEAKKRGIANKIDGLGIVVGAILFAGGIWAGNNAMGIPNLAEILFVVAYLILGGKIVLTAGKNILKGRIFDENFLMSIATIGAFCIGEFAEAVGVMIFYRIGELFEHVAVEKSRGQIMDAVDMRPEVVQKIVGDDIEEIPAQDAKVGDILVVRPGDRIPLDGMVVLGESRIDTSAVTGEPIPLKVQVGEAVLSGCVNTSGLLHIKVEKILEESMVTRILNSVENAAASKPKIDRFITRFSRVYTPVVVVVALLTAIVPSLITGDWESWIYTALTFLVISCPCALVLSVPLAFFSGIGAGSKRGILFKGGVALETIGKIKAVIMDKTGTITKGNFEVQKGIALHGMNEETLLGLAASCEQNSTHPIGVSIVKAAKERNIKIEKAVDIKEIAGKGIQVQLEQGEVLCGNAKLMESYGVDISDYKVEVAQTEVLLALEGVWIGYLMISDTIKEDAKSAISHIKKMGISTVMLTGDGKESAQAVAKATGVEEVYAKLLPEEKLTRLQEIRKKKGAVMFVGDGINDAPVLAGADVGAAMGSGADAAIEAADVVFMNSSLEAIAQSITIARKTNQIAIQNVSFALAMKAIVMILGLAGFANMWMAVFADSGVAMICVMNAIRILYKKG